MRDLKVKEGLIARVIELRTKIKNVNKEELNPADLAELLALYTELLKNSRAVRQVG